MFIYIYYFILLVFNVRENGLRKPVPRTSINACKSNNNSWNQQIFKEFYY